MATLETGSGRIDARLRRGGCGARGDHARSRRGGAVPRAGGRPRNRRLARRVPDRALARGAAAARAAPARSRARRRRARLPVPDPRLVARRAAREGRRPHAARRRVHAARARDRRRAPRRPVVGGRGAASFRTAVVRKVADAPPSFDWEGERTQMSFGYLPPRARAVASARQRRLLDAARVCAAVELARRRTGLRFRRKG